MSDPDRAVALARNNIGHGWPIPPAVAAQVLALLDQARARVAELEAFARAVDAATGRRP